MRLVKPFCLAIILALVASLTPGANAFAADTRAVLTLRVNTVAKSEVTVTMRGSDVLLTRADLQDSGIKGLDFHGAKPDDLVPLSAFKSFMTYTVDDKALTLDLTVSADHLGVATFNYHQQAALTISKPAHSAFMNYSVGLSSAAGPNVTTQFGTRIGAGLLETTRTFSGYGTYNAAITRWTVDSPQSNERMSIGDVDLSTGDLGSSVSLLGGEIHRYFGLTPNSLINVLPGVRGSVGTPATANVYVNGALVKTETLGPGEFSFQNLPTGLGPNNTQIVITDAFGHQQTYTNYFFGADQLLAPGVSDFAYGAGIPRAFYGQTPGTTQFGVGGRYTKGVTNNLTVGGRMEASASLVSGGGEALFRLHQGVLGMEGAFSRSGNATGGAAAVTLQEMVNRFSMSASVGVQSPQYATLGQNVLSDRALTNASLGLSAPMGKSTVGLSYNALKDRDNGIQQGWQLTRWSRLSGSTSIQLSANLMQTVTGKQFSVTASLNLMAGHDMNANINTSESNGHRQLSVDVSRSNLTSVPSFGYNVGLASSDSNTVSSYASGEYRGQYGNYFGTVYTGGGSSSVTLQLAGGIVAIGGKFFATQPVNDSYALVDTGMPGVHVTVNGFDAGRTNRSGYALVPQMGAYFNNTISLQPGDVPMNYSLDQSTQTVVPEYRTGEVVHFRIRRVLPVTGNLSVLMAGHPTIPAYGILELTGENEDHATSDIGENGEFYFDKLEPGNYHGRIQFKGGECKFNITVHGTEKMFLRLGTLTCKNGVPS